MNKYQKIIAEALRACDTEGRVKSKPLVHHRSIIAELDAYMANSPKWKRCARGYMTVDDKIVFQYSSVINQPPRLGYNY